MPWSWYKSEYIIPVINNWKSIRSDKPLPIVSPHIKDKYNQFEKYYRIQLDPNVIRGHLCKEYKVINTTGEIEDLCMYCKKAIEFSASTNLNCVFTSENKDKDSMKWDLDMVRNSGLLDTIELPIYALAENIERVPSSIIHRGNYEFRGSLVRHNLKFMLHNDKFYNEVFTDYHFNYFVSKLLISGIQGMPLDSKRAEFNAKIKRILDKFSKFSDSELDAKMRDMTI